MGGMKRKIPVEKIKKKDPRAVAFSIRRNGLYSKASKLCLLSGGSQVAILAAPVSSNSHVSFYSFAHSSADSVLSAFLNNERPPPPVVSGSKFWWQDESLSKSDNPNELKTAVDTISSMLQEVKALKVDLEKKQHVIHETHHDNQNLILQSTCDSLAVQDYVPDNNNVQGCDNKYDELSLDQIFDLVRNSELDNVLTNQNQCSASEKDGTNQDQILTLPSTSGNLCVHDSSPENNNNKNDQMFDLVTYAEMGHLGGCEDLKEKQLDLHETHQEDQIPTLTSTCESPDNNNNNSNDLLEEFTLDQIFDLVMNSEMDNVSTNQTPWSVSEDDVALVMQRDSEISDNNIMSDLPRNLDGWNQELDLDQISDFGTNSSPLLEDASVVTTNQSTCSDSEGVEDGAVEFHRDLDEDNLCFSDFFNELTPIAAL